MNRDNRSIIKLYKDLMVSKRELSDLRVSIHNTLNGLTQPNQPKKKKLCLKCKQFYDVASAHGCKLQIQKGGVQSMHAYPIRDFLPRNIKPAKPKQTLCQICNQMYTGTVSMHEEQCGQKRFECSRCGGKIKRKDLDQHISKCCFHGCQKCKKPIYYQAYRYHIKNCMLKTHRFSQLGQDLIKTQKIKMAPFSKYMPVCIVK